MVLRLHHLSHAVWVIGLHKLAKLLAFAIQVVFSAILPPETRLPDDLILHHRGLGVVIHPNVMIGTGCQLQHHACLATDVARQDPRSMIIGDNVVIGAHAIVIGPVRIGERAVIGAGAVVTRDVPAGTIVGGVPARVLTARASA